MLTFLDQTESLRVWYVWYLSLRVLDSLMLFCNYWCLQGVMVDRHNALQPLLMDTMYVGTRTILALKINQTSKKFQITYLSITYTCISKIHVHFKWNCHFITLSISFVNWLEIGISPSYVFRQMDNRIRIKLPMYIVQLIICTCWLLGISLCV